MNNIVNSQNRVAIIVITMNRPDFIARKLRFYDMTKNGHNICILDSSNEENARKIKETIKKYNNLMITYKWVPPGKDYTYQLLPELKEKYCFHMGDDDLIIPDTVTACANFLETHPEYGTCSGQHINIRFGAEDYNESYGKISRISTPMNWPYEDEDNMARVKHLWSSTTACICFAVRRVETEIELRNILRHFGLLEDMYEFILLTVLALAGKYKVLDKLGYVMQISDLRTFDHGLTVDLFSFPPAKEQWEVYLNGVSKILMKKGLSEKDAIYFTKKIFILYLDHQYETNIGWLAKPRIVTKEKRHVPFKRLRAVASKIPFLKQAYHKFSPPPYPDNPASRYYRDFKLVRDFLENTRK